MRFGSLALAGLLAGCLRAPSAPGEDTATACGRVFEPLHDPAGFRQDAPHEIFAMPRDAVPPGGQVFTDAAAYAAAWGDETPRQVDFSNARVVALRAVTAGCNDYNIREMP